MSPLDEKTPSKSGVWKSGRGKGRKTPKGRQLDDGALAEVLALLGDLLIEGKRGMPRHRPPYVAQIGVFDCRRWCTMSRPSTG